MTTPPVAYLLFALRFPERVCLRSIDVISRRARIVPTATASYGHRLCKNIKGRSATRRSRLNGAGLLRRGFEPGYPIIGGLITLFSRARR